VVTATIWNRTTQRRGHFFLNVDDEFGLTQTFDEARVLTVQLLDFLIPRMAIGLRARISAGSPLLRGCCRPVPGRQSSSKQEYRPSRR
jgi:hypothetical protein